MNAFRLVPLVESIDTAAITALVVSKNQIHVGTTEGTLYLYHLQDRSRQKIPSPPGKFDVIESLKKSTSSSSPFPFRRVSADATVTQLNFHEAVDNLRKRIEMGPLSPTTTEEDTPRSILKSENKCVRDFAILQIGRKAILQMERIIELNLIFILCDGEITAVEMDTLYKVVTLPFPKGIGCFGIQRWLTDNPSPSYMVCAAVKSRLHLLNLDGLTITKELSVPEIPLRISWLESLIYVAYQNEYSCISVKTGAVEEIVQEACTKNAVLLPLPTEEMAIGAHNTLLRDILHPTSAKTFSWQHPARWLAHSFPFLIALTNKQIEIRNRYSSDYHEILPCLTGNVLAGNERLILVGTNNQVLALSPVSLSYQCASEDLLRQVLLDPLSDAALSHFINTLFRGPDNPFGHMLYRYSHRFNEKYQFLPSPDSLDRYVKATKIDITVACRRISNILLSFFVELFETGDPPPDLDRYLNSAKTSVRSVFFSKISFVLMALYKKLREKEDEAYNRSLNKVQELSIGDYHIRKKFWLNLDCLEGTQTFKSPHPNRSSPTLHKTRTSFSGTLYTPENSRGESKDMSLRKSMFYLDERSYPASDLYFNKKKKAVMWMANDRPFRFEFPSESKYSKFKQEVGSQMQPSILSLTRLRKRDSFRETLLESGTPTAAPYEKAIFKLRTLPSLYAPQEKLECLFSALQETIAAVDDFWGAVDSKKSVSVGADDLMPILSYVVAKAKVPYIHAELSFLYDFSHEQVLAGEYGYCLVSITTAVEALQHLVGESVQRVPTQMDVSEAEEPDDFIEKTFGLAGEKLIDKYSCSLSMRRGTLYVTTNYLCHEASSLFDVLWRQQRRVTIPITSITYLKKTNFALALPTCLQVTCVDGLIYNLDNFISRNECFDLIVQQAQKLNHRINT